MFPFRSILAMRGVATVTKRWGGMRWTRARRLTNGVSADGQGVWS